MKSLGIWLAIFGVGSLLLNLMGMEFKILMWIDNWGHVGGLLGGGLFALIAAPVYRIENDEVEFRLVNRTTPDRVWIAAVLVAIIFGGLAITKFVF